MKAYGREFCKDKTNCPPAAAQTDHHQAVGQLENLNHLNHLNFNVPSNLITNSAPTNLEAERKSPREAPREVPSRELPTKEAPPGEIPIREAPPRQAPAETPPREVAEAPRAVDNSALTRQLHANQAANERMIPGNELNKQQIDDLARFYHSQKNAPLPDTLNLTPRHLLANHFSVNNKILDGLSSNAVPSQSESVFDGLANLASDSSSERVSSISPPSNGVLSSQRTTGSPSSPSKLHHINLLSHIKHGVEANRNSQADDQKSAKESEPSKESGLSKENESKEIDLSKERTLVNKEDERSKQNSQLIDTGGGRQPIRSASNHLEYDLDDDDEHSGGYAPYQIEPYGRRYHQDGHHDPFAERFDRLPKIVHPAGKQLKKHHKHHKHHYDLPDHKYHKYRSNYKSDKSDYYDPEDMMLDSHLLGASRLRLTHLQPQFADVAMRQRVEIAKPATVLPRRTDKSAGNDLNETKNANKAAANH